MNPDIEQITELFREYDSINHDIELIKPEARIAARNIRTRNLRYGEGEYKRPRNSPEDKTWSDYLDLLLGRDQVLVKYHKRLIIHDGDIKSFRRKYHKGVEEFDLLTEDGVSAVDSPLIEDFSLREHIFYTLAAQSQMGKGIVGIIHAEKKEMNMEEYPLLWDMVYHGNPVRLKK